MNEQVPVIEIHGLKNFLGGRWVHQGVDLTVHRGEIIGIVGGSGCGKTTLLRSILMLRKPEAGIVKIFDVDLNCCDPDEILRVQKRWGVLFQQGALFSSLSVLENVMFPLRAFTDIEKTMREQIALLKLAFVGLSSDVAKQYPAELSGGMRKRAAAARAIALDPELLLLDEPTSGLDPQGAGAMDQLVLHLRDTLGLTVVIITHDLDTLWRITDRVAFLGEGRVLAMKPIGELVKEKHPEIVRFFSGPRGQLRGQH